MMKIKICCVLLIAAILLCAAVHVAEPVFAAGKSQAEDAIASDLSAFYGDTKCDSVSAVTYDGKELHFYGDSKGLYRIGSMTKAFTGLAVMKLIDEGAFRGESSLSDLIPGFEAFYEGTPAKITVNDLLMQKSGFTNDESVYPAPSPDMTLAEWAGSVSGTGLQSAPGSVYAYSNVNYNLLGYLIERVSNMSYQDYMEQSILRPLGLMHTYAGEPDDGERIIQGTRLGFRHAFACSFPVAEAAIPAGYFYASAEDMGRWIRIWTGAEETGEPYSRLIASVKEHLMSEGDYFAGWERFAGGRIGHSGGTADYSARIVFPDDGSAGVCVLTNLNVAASTDSLCNRLLDRLQGQEPGEIQTDVWTVFDLIFTVLLIAGILWPVIFMRFHRRSALILSSGLTAALLASILIVMPYAFGAGLGPLLMKWSPYSFGATVAVLGIDLLLALMRCLMRKQCSRESYGARR